MTSTTTGADYIRAAARLIRARGATTLSYGTLPPRHKIIPAACEALAQPGAAPRDLTAHQAGMLDEILDHIEADFGCPLPAWERIHANDTPWSVAWRLDLAARHYSRALAAAAA